MLEMAPSEFLWTHLDFVDFNLEVSLHKRLEISKLEAYSDLKD